MRGQSLFGAADAADAVWRPGPEQLARSRLARAMQRWGLADLPALHRASVERPDWFWPAAAEDLGVAFRGAAGPVHSAARGKPFARWFEGRQFNAAWSCVERHARDPRLAGKEAVVYEGDAGQRRALTYAQLDGEAGTFAAALAALGVGRGDRVTLFMPPVPEAAAAVLGCAKLGAIAVPAFSGYGSEALATRLNASQSKLLVTVDATTRRGKPVAMKAIADEAALRSPALAHMVVVGAGAQPAALQPGRDHLWADLPALAAGRRVEAVALDPNDPLFIIYTSGTTGAPKGIVHSHGGFVLKAAVDFGYLFDIQHDDVVAWIADMGWMLGPLMVIGGLHLGATIVLVEGLPDHPEPGRLWRVAQRNRATLLGIAPTAARGLRAASDGARPEADLSSLRAFASTGEAWDVPTWHWLFGTVGGARLPILNYTGGTEIGGGILSCYTIAPQAPASFSGPVPGMDVDVYGADGQRVADGIGELVVLNTWPGMAHSFWNDDARYLDTYWNRWDGVWVHGDLASVDAQGRWHIHGRSDDTLKIGGRRIGPAEIESALVAQPGVAEAGVVGAPDAMKGQTAVAFVVARPGAALDEDVLARQMVAAVGKGMLPSRIHVVATLPKTKNGKIMRRAIRARYLGDPPGDLSALDPATPLENIPVRG
ncbi:AMP-binding protein [Pseudorhodoferax sp.]|uniref:AMP-binding protein n=1 Tax=Pseudorhodoferax sp. TaxID=1993553 RepID=UPI002DD6532E|nr:AMP-binding protein [Pseudorhodoferax sp.]